MVNEGASGIVAQAGGVDEAIVPVEVGARWQERLRAVNGNPPSTISSSSPVGGHSSGVGSDSDLKNPLIGAILQALVELEVLPGQPLVGGVSVVIRWVYQFWVIVMMVLRSWWWWWWWWSCCDGGVGVDGDGCLHNGRDGDDNDDDDDDGDDGWVVEWWRCRWLDDGDHDDDDDVDDMVPWL